MRALAVTLLASSLLPAAAAAKCMRAQPLLAPRTVPERAEVYLLVPGDELTALRVQSSAGTAIPHSWKLHAHSGVLRVYAIQLDATGAQRAIVRWTVGARWPTEGEAELQVDRRWERPKASGVEILSQADEVSSWTCSYQQTRNLTATSAAELFRVVYATSEAAYVAGETRSVILPGDMIAFFRGKPAGRRIELGHVDCLGHTVDPEDRRIFAGVQELFADGSATPLPARPIEVELPRR